MDEWLATNGVGGYAMGGLPAPDAGMNRRRYHGLLVAAASPPVGRIVALHSVVDHVEINGVTADLATQQFAPVDAPVTHPDGWRHLEAFAATLPHEARWTYLVNETRVRRTLTLLPGRNAAELTWSAHGAPARLRCRVLTPMRDFHALGHQHEQAPPVELLDERTLRIIRWDMELQLRLSHGNWKVEPQWWRDFFYPEDRLRGQECTEDVWSPGEFEAPLNQPITLHAELVQPVHAAPARRRQSPPAQRETEAQDRLKIAAGQFVVQRRLGDTWSTSIIAGYPWFADWGRDTMISLPGLLLCTGRRDEAEAALLTFARHIRNGLIPNRFDDYGGAAHYNTVDASLWFVHAVHALHKARNHSVRSELVAACRTIIAAYRSGTDYDICLDGDGLIAAGSAETQLTWMDARRDGVTFTPRHGKAIEINALWHHGLHCLAAITDDEVEANDLRKLAGATAQSMREQFWNGSRGCCYDVLTPDASGGWAADEAVRPNQVFAVSLAHSPFTPEQQQGIVNIIAERLLTPFGLRTLEPGHPQYRGHFEGDLMRRDGAYHQGTVWPWLIGPYVEAVLRVGGFSRAARNKAARCLEPLVGALDSGCFGQLAEVYDGDEPHRPSGCPAQAWSVAEVLRGLLLCQVEPDEIRKISLA